MLRAATLVAYPGRHGRPTSTPDVAQVAPPPCRARSARIDPVFLALAFFLPAGLMTAAEKPVDGLIVQVPTTVTTESTGRLRSLLHGPVKSFELGAARQGGRFVLICDFNPEGRRAESESAASRDATGKQRRPPATAVTAVPYRKVLMPFMTIGPSPRFVGPRHDVITPPGTVRAWKGPPMSWSSGAGSLVWPRRGT